MEGIQAKCMVDKYFLVFEINETLMESCWSEKKDQLYMRPKLKECMEFCSIQSLLIDSYPLTNILNDPFNAIHPTRYLREAEDEKSNKPYLTTVHMSYLRKLRNSNGMSVPDFCERYAFGQERWNHSNPEISATCSSMTKCF